MGLSQSPAATSHVSRAPQARGEADAAGGCACSWSKRKVNSHAVEALHVLGHCFMLPTVT